MHIFTVLGSGKIADVSAAEELLEETEDQWTSAKSSVQRLTVLDRR